MATELECLAALADRYRIERELGRGGMAVVYLAEDLRHGRMVAVKLLQSERFQNGSVARFAREIALTARLTHPNILPLLDSGEAAGCLYYVLPYVDGESLRQRLERERQLPVEEAIRIAREVAGALGHAHDHGIVHRDVKPENILFEAGHAVLCDFGIARAWQRVEPSLTHTGLVVGTVLYMSPEQASGERELDARSDVYALACVVYEMLAGHPPFAGGTMQAIMARKALGTAPSLRAVRRKVSPELEAVVMRALAPVPADRFANATEFARALEEAARPTPLTGGRTRRSRGRTLAVALGIAVIAAGAWMALTSDEVRIDSLAVLPLRDASGSSDRAHQLDALHASMITELGRLGGPRVISQFSALRYRESDKSLLEIARELGVDAIVHATIYPSGDSVRLGAHLIRTVPYEEQLWSGTYAREVRTMAELPNDLARGIAGELLARPPATGAPPARGTPLDPAALDAYARGRVAWNTFTEAGFDEAIARFEEAIAIDSNYAAAHVGLADVYNSLPYYAAVAPKDAFPKARAAALRAIALDPSLGEAYAALGWTAAVHDWDWSEARRNFARALDLNPNNSTARRQYSFFLAWMGRFDEAIQQALLARSLDPLSPRVTAHLGLMHHLSRDYDRAIELYKQTAARYPGFARVRWDLARAYANSGDNYLAIETFREALAIPGQSTAGSTTSIAWLGAALARAGRESEARAILDEIEVQATRTFVSAMSRALIYVALGQHDEAMRWLERAHEERAADMVLLNTIPDYDPLRGDPRFRDLVRRLSFADTAESRPTTQ